MGMFADTRFYYALLTYVVKINLHMFCVHVHIFVSN